jgi:hypothetical protein
METLWKQRALRSARAVSGRPGFGRVREADLPSPSAEPAAAVKGRRPDPERSERVDCRPRAELPGADAQRRELAALNTERVDLHESSLVRVVPVAAGEDASEASARSRAAGGERSEPPLTIVKKVVTSAQDPGQDPGHPASCREWSRPGRSYVAERSLARRRSATRAAICCLRSSGQGVSGAHDSTTACATAVLSAGVLRPSSSSGARGFV